LPAAGRFLVDSRKHETFKKNNLRARPLERSTCVRVENLPALVNKTLLELIFEQWGPVEEVFTIPSEHAAIITFKEEEAKEIVLKKDINICDVPVKIYTYFKSIDMVLYGGNRPHLKLPEPITVRVHPSIREFLLKKEQISFIKNQMSSHFCQIDMDKPEILLSPDPALLKQKEATRIHIDDWSKNAFDAFMKIISNYAMSEWPLSHPLWSKVENVVKEVVKDRVFTDMDVSKGVLTMAGMTHEIIGLKPIMEKILENATYQMEREKNSVTEHMEMSPAMYSLLLQDGLKSAVSPQLHIDHNRKINRLVLSGLHTEILVFKNWVLEKKINMIQKPLKIDCSILEFLRLVDSDEMSTDLFICHGIAAVYTIKNGDVVLTGTTERALAEAEKRVKMALTSRELIIEDHSVLQMPEWEDLKRRLEISFSISKKRFVCINLSQTDKVIVTGFKDPVMEVSVNIERFIEKHTRIEETVRVKSQAAVEFIKDRKSHDWQHFVKSDKMKVNFDSKRPWIKLSGERLFVQQAMTFFRRLADSLHTDTLTIKKTGAKKYFEEQGKIMLSMFVRENGFVVVLQEDDMLEEEEGFSQGSIGRVSNSCLKVYTMQVGHLTLEVSSGDITKEKTDAIVNTSNKTFSLKSGVSKAILDAAGLEVEQELLQMASDTDFQLTEIVTSSGMLLCKEIIHVVGCFRPADIENNVLSVLDICEKHKFTSVAFPALGTGQGGANPADVAEAMISAVVDFAIKNEPVHVKSVKFLIFQTSMLPSFHQSMIKRSMEPKKGRFSRIKGKKITLEEIEPVVFQLCGETPDDLSKASAMIESLIKQEHLEITIRDPAIAQFSKEESEMLSTMERELKVSVITDKKSQDVITLKGLTGFVHTAESRIRDMIRKVERNENQTLLASLMSSIVEWQYQSGHNFKAFDVFTNCVLEEALNHQKMSVKIKINSIEYDVDILKKVATKGKKRIELKRVDLKAQSSLPSNWVDMKGESVVLVKLTAGSQEFADVEQEFRKYGLSSNIIQIERVQNSALWRSYMIKKEEMEHKSKHENYEKHLFHGTGSDKTDQINHYGFNRSYAGMHGALYGNGTYFAVDPLYSAQSYSKPDAKGNKRMYLARVLVGDFTQGQKGLLTPPRKSSKGVHLYDSVTDKIKNPSMFVIFNDVQAYPEYLITFRD
ncbi:protein mono-ADP-ribosyltransferase PARP14-like, partial [Megalobrama amblycephala]|uniref:protein mono-ADP-ribosyltransferase PARP14-like n=1 Tax=Megalobrama amblycephala TaxID=75352 RepID=UPI002014776F